MKDRLRVKASTLMDVYAQLKKEYKWRSNDISLRFTACIYALTGKAFAFKEFDQATKHIKKSTGLFSYFRSSLLYPIAAQLVNNFDDPQQAFAQILEYDKALKANGFKSTSQRGIAAYALLLTCPHGELESRISRAMKLYKRMKKEHPWLTSANSYGVVVLLAAENQSLDSLLNKMEENYQLLREHGFKRSSGLQLLSHLLTFSPEPGEELSRRCQRIMDFLQTNRLKVSSMYYGAIGLMALLGESCYQGLDDIVEMADYLKENKAFKWYYKELNLMMICALVANEYVEDQKQQNLGTTSLGIAMEALIAAQTAAMFTVIATTSAATNAGTSSN